MHRLIDTQTSLLRHLTSPAFIFGTRDLGSAGLDSDLQGMDIRRLRLEAEFSYSKRMNRIRQTFGRTATLLGHGFTALTRDFAAACPPRTYERYPDAKGFLDHFLKRSAQKPPTPAWAVDVASIELTMAGRGHFAPRPWKARPWRRARNRLLTCGTARTLAPFWCVVATMCGPCSSPPGPASRWLNGPCASLSWPRAGGATPWCWSSRRRPSHCWNAPWHGHRWRRRGRARRQHPRHPHQTPCDPRPRTGERQ